MAHEHSHGEENPNYYVFQLVSLAGCGLMAVTAILLYKTGFLIEYKILTPDFIGYVLAGGVLLAAQVFFRMVGLFLTTGASAEEHIHGHSHAEHSHAHSHAEHSHAEHSHGGVACDDPDHATIPLPVVDRDNPGAEEHDESMAPLRFTVLLIPSLLILVCLGFGIRLPKELGEDYLSRRLKVDNLDLGHRVESQKGVKPIRLQFNELARAAIFPKTREYFDGKRAILRGQYRKIDDKEFQLYKVDMKCCTADQVLLKARIICKETVQVISPNEWIEVEGDIQFVKAKGGSEEWVPVVYVDSESQIRKTQPD